MLWGHGRGEASLRLQREPLEMLPAQAALNGLLKKGKKKARYFFHVKMAIFLTLREM